MGKNDPSTDRMNSQSGANELRGFVERIENIESDEKALKEDKKEIYTEAKGRGYDTKMIRKLIGERKRDPNDVAEEESVYDLYREALGMTGASLSADPADEDDEEETDDEAEGMV